MIDGIYNAMPHVIYITQTFFLLFLFGRFEGMISARAREVKLTAHG